MLTLPIKKKWFDMILSGEKKEEYREIKPYWFTRFKNNLIIYEYDWLGDCIEISKGRGTVIFKNGYQKNAPKIKCGIEITTGYGKKEWGAKLSELYYVLKILSVEEVSNND